MANDKLIVYHVFPVVLMPRKDADGNNLSSLQNTAKCEKSLANMKIVSNLSGYHPDGGANKSTSLSLVR